MTDPHPLVCRFGAFGDMVMMTPFLRHLHHRCGHRCDLIAIGAWNKPMFLHSPWVRDVFTIDSRSQPYWLNRSQRELVTTLKKIRHRHVWICETNPKSYRLLARAGIHRGNSINELDFPAAKNEHFCDQWLRLANQSSPGFDYPALPVADRDSELFVHKDEIDECRRWLITRGIATTAPLICIQPGNKKTTRRGKVSRDSNTKYWPESRWAQVIDEIIRQLPDAQVLLCGVPAESRMNHDILTLCNNRTAVFPVEDDLPMRRLLALLSIAESCISVDTGPAHAAAAVKCPLVVLFGKANPDRCQPVSQHSKVVVVTGKLPTSTPSQHQIDWITPQQVVDAWQSTR